jgi:hypothetical protein
MAIDVGLLGCVWKIVLIIAGILEGMMKGIGRKYCMQVLQHYSIVFVGCFRKLQGYLWGCCRVLGEE